MGLEKVRCYRSGPIEKDSKASFHRMNTLDGPLRDLGIEIIGDSFECLESRGTSQEVYAKTLKGLRNQGRFCEFSKVEMLLKVSLRSVKRATFMIIRPSFEASGGTVSETLQAWLSGIPKLIICGAHGENLLDNNSTFMIRMLTDRFSLVFNTEKDVLDFIRKNFTVFKAGREAVRQLILLIKGENSRINDRPRALAVKEFEGKTAIILGLPGSGKTLQSRMLQDLAGFKYFGSGHELRRLSSKFPMLGESLGRGNLAPEIIINHLLSSSLLRLESFESVVLDGSPKKVGEAKGLRDLLILLKRMPHVFVIEIEESLAIQRMKLRRNCDLCETSFCGPEFVENPICPSCGGVLTIRPENASGEAIKKILDWYKTDVSKVISYFGRLNTSFIDGNESAVNIFEFILTALKR